LALSDFSWPRPCNGCFARRHAPVAFPTQFLRLAWRHYGLSAGFVFLTLWSIAQPLLIERQLAGFSPPSNLRMKPTVFC
jgi:hypothetical protein